MAELRRRCAWTSPPSYYGVYGWESWQSRTSGPGQTASPLEELLTDCFTFVFLERLPRLRAQLATKPNIDGLAMLYLRNYLHDRRKHHDLVGFQIFESLRGALRQAVESSELWVVDGNPKISNDTILAASPQADPSDAVSAEMLAPLVDGWTGELLPDLFTAAGPRRRQVVQRLRHLILDLEGEGAIVFSFKSLIDMLKRALRAAWAAIFDLTEGETALATPPSGYDTAPVDFASVARLAKPEPGIEARESFEKLVDCVAQRVETESEPGRTRHQLRHLWGFLRAWAQSGDTESLPSSRRLEQMLRIPRKQIPALWKILKETVMGCQHALDGRLSATAKEVR